MYNGIKNIIKKNKRIFNLLMIFKLLSTASIKKLDGSIKKYPKVIQFPITYKCNSRCVMCNIWKMDHSNEMTLAEIKNYLKDPIFKEVSSVGINGGEPSLVKELPQIAEQVLNLPKIKSLNIISNGFNKDALLVKVEKIYELCRKKSVNFHLSFSLDGYGEVHDNVRGVKKAFERASKSIDYVLENKSRYCDSIDIGCTIVRQNVNSLIELDTYASRKNYPMKYRLGIENKRIGSDEIVSDYSVLCDTKSRQFAKEFIHSRFFKANEIMEKFKYFSLFYFLAEKNPKRLLGCMWQDEGITIDAKGNIYYCAVASKKIGSLRKQKGEAIFFNEKNIAYKKSILENMCQNCIHDYSGKPYIGDVLIFLKHYIFERIWCKIYRIKLIWL
ncbi:MAG: radical SAM protein [Deltaproteobacteria bacterium]|nr:radical SAM protein [Deltaproteobacteria bacterium]